MSNYFNQSSVSGLNLAIAFLLTALVSLLPEIAHATGLTGSTAVSRTICSIIRELQGPIARGVAAFGIIFIGFSLFLGKMSWGVGLALGIGLGAVFGAKDIVGVIGDGTIACDKIPVNQT